MFDFKMLEVKIAERGDDWTLGTLVVSLMRKDTLTACVQSVSEVLSFGSWLFRERPKTLEYWQNLRSGSWGYSSQVSKHIWCNYPKNRFNNYPELNNFKYQPKFKRPKFCTPPPPTWPGIISVGLFWPTYSTKLLQKGLFVPNLKKIVLKCRPV